MDDTYTFLDSLLEGVEPTTFDTSSLDEISGSNAISEVSPRDFIPVDPSADFEPSFVPGTPESSPEYLPTMSPKAEADARAVFPPPDLSLDDSRPSSPESGSDEVVIDKKVTTKGKRGKAKDPATKKRKLEGRRERKNTREKMRRTELNALFDNMVDLLGLPKEAKADKVTVLASAIHTIKQLRTSVPAAKAVPAALTKTEPVYQDPAGAALALQLQARVANENAKRFNKQAAAANNKPLTLKVRPLQPNQNMVLADELTFFNPDTVFDM